MYPNNVERLRFAQMKTGPQIQMVRESCKQGIFILKTSRFLQRFLKRSGIDDFCLIDIFFPEPKRTRYYIAEILSFIRFREQEYVVFKEKLDEIVLHFY
jgi:hypothetical protein